MSKKNRKQRQAGRLSDKEQELSAVMHRELVPIKKLRGNDNLHIGATAPKERIMDTPKKSIFRRIGSWVKNLFVRKADETTEKKSIVRKAAAVVAYPFEKTYQGAAFVARKITAAVRTLVDNAGDVLYYTWYLVSRLAVLAAAIFVASLLLAIAEPVLQVLLGIVAFVMFFRVISWVATLAEEDVRRQFDEPEDRGDDSTPEVLDNLHVAATS